MTIHLTEDLERLVAERAAASGVDSSSFVTELLREALANEHPDASQADPAAHTPISVRFEEVRRKASPEALKALEELPSDFAAELDHYVYGTPKQN